MNEPARCAEKGAGGTNAQASRCALESCCQFQPSELGVLCKQNPSALSLVLGTELNSSCTPSGSH